ncbi:uncharacterized protein DNG_09222 [Cephalotrichum gorgonifer]|uniref:Azaphilone pigments biosynthesis cluster protein L N-terminal domain-containing protein n=1 Tax=Cephalotrichum gorgonifer TaxID=2041049 RepID=A0AAE8N5F3_9PEZI|nr:uncharacterized protein DNG_09222 [Cephalotrichum gorgonifer]
MEALGAGANALAFVVLALKSAKTIYAVIGDLKDGPNNVRRAITNVNRLLSTLDQLSKCRALDERGSNGLADRMLTCLKDLETFSTKLEGLRVTKSEKRLGMYWKRVKAVLNEKALDNMNDVVAGHTSALNLQLAALQSETVFGVPDQLDMIKKELVSQRTTRETETRIWREQRMEWREVPQNVGHAKNTLATIHKEVQVMSSSQAAGHSRTDAKLDEILEQLLTLQLQRQSSSRGVEVKGRDSHKQTPAKGLRVGYKEETCSELMESLARLCRLADKKSGRVAPGESEDIIKSLLAIMTWMMSQEFLRGATTSGLVDTKPCTSCDGQHLQDIRTCVSSVYSVLLSARHITLNDQERIRQQAPGVWCSHHWTTEVYDFGLGVLLVRSCTEYHDYQHPSQSGTPNSNFQHDSFVEEVTTSITLIPSRMQGVGQMLNITSHQLHGDQGTFSSIPTLSVNNILPAGSPVFSTVREGRMRDFLALLRDGKASIRDHDEYGASLLHKWFTSDAVRRYRDGLIYLIRNGADVLAKNNDGISVSQAAYRPYASGLWKTVKKDNIGGFSGDLWDCALASCGFDVPTFRRGFARRSDYTELYTREHFEILWEDREHLCPYYHDDESEIQNLVECMDDEDASEWTTTDSEDDWTSDDLNDEQMPPEQRDTGGSPTGSFRR